MHCIVVQWSLKSFNVDLLTALVFSQIKKILFLVIRAWDKGPTAEVESSQGRFNPTKSRVKSTLKSTF